SLADLRGPADFSFGCVLGLYYQHAHIGGASAAFGVHRREDGGQIHQDHGVNVGGLPQDLNQVLNVGEIREVVDVPHRHMVGLVFISSDDLRLEIADAAKNYGK